MSGRNAPRAVPLAPDFEALLGYVPKAGLLDDRVIAITGLPRESAAHSRWRPPRSARR